MEIPEFMIWVKEEPFLIGLVTATPCSRIATDLLLKLAKYCRGKEGYYPKLNLLQWGHICRYKLQLPTDLSWLYIRMYDIISKKFEISPENTSGSNGDHHKRNDHWDRRCEEIRQSNGVGIQYGDMKVNTLEFLVFLYLQHYPRLHKKYFTRSTQSSDEPWPAPNYPYCGSPGGSPSPTRRPAGSPKHGAKRKTSPEQIQTEFLEANIEDIVNLLKSCVNFGEGIKLDEDTIPIEVVKALTFILGSASTSLNKEYGSLEESFSQIPAIAEAVGYNKALKTVSQSKFVKWVKANLKLNPWGPSSTPISQIRANHLSGSWDKSKAQQEMYRAFWNSQPSSKSWYLIYSVDNQVFLLDKVVPFSSLRIHRCSNSFIYAPGSFSSVIVEKCQNCTIFLGPAGKVVRISDCDSIKVTAVGRMFNLFDNSRSTFHLLTPCQPVVSGTKNRKLYFAPYNSFYPRLLEDMKPLELGVKIQKWNKAIELGPHGLPLLKDLQHGGPYHVHCNLLRAERFEELVFPFKMDGSTTENPVELPEKYAKALEAFEAKKELLRAIVASKNLNESQTNEFREIINRKFDSWLKKEGHYKRIKGLRTIQESIRSAVSASASVVAAEKESTTKTKQSKPSTSSDTKSPSAVSTKVDENHFSRGPFSPRWVSTGAEFFPVPNKEVTLSTASWLSRVSSSSDVRRRLSTASLDADDDEVFSPTPVDSEDFKNLDHNYSITDKGEDLDAFEDESATLRSINFDDGSHWKAV